MIPKSEVRTKDYLSKRGYYFIRSGRSHGTWDIVAFSKKEILLIQTKFRQWPDREEMSRILAFDNYPKSDMIKRQIWLWRERSHEPIIRELPEGHRVSIQNQQGKI